MELNNIKEFIWNKSIRNSLIASGWFVIISQLVILIWSFFSKIKFFEVYKRIFNFLNDCYCIKGWLIAFLGTIILIAIFLLIKCRIKSKISKKKVVNDIPKETEKPKPLEINIAPTVFFHHRFCDAFPGLDPGFIWFKNNRDINNRLKILLESPTRFDKADGHGLTSDPIWWYRGGSALPIDKFLVLDKNKVLINFDEFKIEKIAAYRGKSYYRDFVYVQCLPDKPVGLYNHNQLTIETYIQDNIEYTEEFGIYKGKFITRQEYDDGSAIIKGKPVKTSGAELRARTLTKFNFIITSKFSPYNCDDFHKNSDDFFVNLLNERIPFEEFVKWMEKFPKNHYDY